MKKIVFALILLLNISLVAQPNNSEPDVLSSDDYSNLEFDFYDVDIFGEKLLLTLNDNFWRILGIESFPYTQSKKWAAHPARRRELEIAVLVSNQNCESAMECVRNWLVKAEQEHLLARKDEIVSMSYTREFRDVFAVVSRLSTYERESISQLLENQRTVPCSKTLGERASEDDLQQILSCF